MAPTRALPCNRCRQCSVAVNIPKNCRVCVPGNPLAFCDTYSSKSIGFFQNYNQYVNLLNIHWLFCDKSNKSIGYWLLVMEQMPNRFVFCVAHMGKLHLATSQVWLQKTNRLNALNTLATLQSKPQEMCRNTLGEVNPLRPRNLRNRRKPSLLDPVGQFGTVQFSIPFDAACRSVRFCR